MCYCSSFLIPNDACLQGTCCSSTPNCSPGIFCDQSTTSLFVSRVPHTTSQAALQQEQTMRQQTAQALYEVGTVCRHCINIFLDANYRANMNPDLLDSNDEKRNYINCNKGCLLHPWTSVLCTLNSSRFQTITKFEIYRSAIITLLCVITDTGRNYFESQDSRDIFGMRRSKYLWHQPITGKPSQPCTFNQIYLHDSRIRSDFLAVHAYIRRTVLAVSLYQRHNQLVC